MVTRLKNSLISKINFACSSTNHFSLYYEYWHVRNPNIFIIRDIFRTLEYSKVRRYLDSCQKYKSLENSSRLELFFQDPPSQTMLDVWQNSKCAHVSVNATQLVQLFQFLFQTYSDIFQHYSRAYSRMFRTPCVSLAYSES